MLDEKALNEMKKMTEESYKKLSQERTKVQAQLGQIDAELIRLQGEYRSLEKVFGKSGFGFKPVPPEKKEEKIK